MALSFIEPELWAIEVYIAGIGILDVLWPWTWSDDLCMRTWPVLPGDTPDVQIWTSYVKAFVSYRLT